MILDSSIEKQWKLIEYEAKNPTPIQLWSQSDFYLSRTFRPGTEKLNAKSLKEIYKEIQSVSSLEGQITLGYCLILHRLPDPSGFHYHSREIPTGGLQPFVHSLYFSAERLQKLKKESFISFFLFKLKTILGLHETLPVKREKRKKVKKA